MLQTFEEVRKGANAAVYLERAICPKGFLLDEVINKEVIKENDFFTKLFKEQKKIDIQAKYEAENIFKNNYAITEVYYR